MKRTVVAGKSCHSGVLFRECSSLSNAQKIPALTGRVLFFMVSSVMQYIARHDFFGSSFASQWWRSWSVHAGASGW